MEQSEINYYEISKTEINSLIDNYFELTNEENTWGKERLTSIKLLSEVFNNYVDFAQETMNFTELDELSEESQSNFEKCLLKNLLFIFKIIENKNLSLSELLTSLNR